MRTRIFGSSATEAAFPLGGIGTGNVSIGSRGEFRDWEIFNRPAKGLSLPNTFFAIWARPENQTPKAKVLEGKLRPPYSRTHGFHPYTAAGLPRMEDTVMEGSYPFVWLRYKDPEFPLHISLEAYTPLIPLNYKDSSIPGAVLTYKVANPLPIPVEVTLAGSVTNPIGGIQYGQYGQLTSPHMARNVNDYRDQPSLRGLYMHSEHHLPNSLHYGNLVLATTWESVTYKRAWFRGSAYEQLQEFWEDFASDGTLDDLGYTTSTERYQTDTGTLGVKHCLQPGETVEFVFYLTWYFPNRINGWNEEIRIKREGKETIKNYYALDYSDAWDIALYLASEHRRLRTETERFVTAVNESTLPQEVIEAAMSNIATLRSTSCFRLENGKFLGYEGCFVDAGCCEGNCTHVWNYAQTVAYLFPELERSMRRTEFLEEVDEDGRMNFRAFRMFESQWNMWGYDQTPPAADGQLGSIMRVYREWKLSGDDAFLHELWPSVKKALNFAFMYWDEDNDLILEGKQHVTYDIDFYGPNPLTGVMLLGALKAATEMASYVGDESVEKYRSALKESSEALHHKLWNGEYYEQAWEDVNGTKYQFGRGCLSDQMLGQQFAHLYGLGYLLPSDAVKQTVLSIYRYNFRRSFADQANCQRTYALNDESGLVLCSWPLGGRPKFPFIYSDEVWSGVEYHVAAHLIMEGFIEEGTEIVRAVRERYDGVRRNPWNETECGNHYVRSMASWGLILAFSGFQADLVKKRMSFHPVNETDEFKTFWSTGSAWGTYKQWRTEDGELDFEVKVLYGNAQGMTVIACGKEKQL